MPDILLTYDHFEKKITITFHDGKHQSKINMTYLEFAEFIRRTESLAVKLGIK